ncbi:glycosyltransferase [Bordetella avium]|uniref:WecB/TagA/CpsF family glycosyltransferase n=1 Tax=Bordetella avium TaxID=521 RepID=UPI000E6A334B|nr:WecB/TagA/CpsF family glycosyltransferase [Bordetella avium]AZY49978.1 capsular biosynthesis protein [Bordetella avium]RIQ17335.1 glycosyltransferase [Bordetella avium]RIQ33820.1 glycosyltransferase [Bordetella avium]
MHSSQQGSPAATGDLPSLPSVRLFGLDIAAVTFDQALESLSQAAERRDGHARVVVTPNVDHVVRLDAAPAFRERYGKAAFIFADGMPVVWASRWLGKPLPERVTGADLFVALCRQAQARRWRVLLLGGMPGSEAALHERFEQFYPGLNIEVVAPPMGFDPLGPQGEAFAEQVRAQAPDVVFLCVGMPKQENWALHYAPTLPGGIVLCVGAAMEFAIGLQRRAPQWMQRIGLEWVWRLASNPRRLWRRYLVDDTRFLALCWRQWRRRRDTAS